MTDPRFPILTQKQIKILKEFGSLINFENETTIFEVGDTAYDFYVVLEGEGRINDLAKENQILAVHGNYEFTGDNSMLSNRSIPFSAYASQGATLLSINPNVLKDIIAKHTDISGALLSAFIQRQETMLREFDRGIKVIGSEHSKEIDGLRDFTEKTANLTVYKSM